MSTSVATRMGRASSVIWLVPALCGLAVASHLLLSACRT